MFPTAHPLPSLAFCPPGLGPGGFWLTKILVRLGRAGLQDLGPAPPRDHRTRVPLSERRFGQERRRASPRWLKTDVIDAGQVIHHYLWFLRLTGTPRDARSVRHLAVWLLLCPGLPPDSTPAIGRTLVLPIPGRCADSWELGGFPLDSWLQPPAPGHLSDHGRGNCFSSPSTFLEVFEG
jgi:hypothetical protein